jgi:hypothetical protein
MKKKFFYLFLVLLLLFSACEIFVIKGRKIVEEDNASYTQTSAIGIVKIFITELLNENYLAASELIVKEDGNPLTAAEKYESITELSRMKRFIEGKNITRELIDTTLGTINVVVELDNGNKAKFITIEKKQSFYILGFLRE